MNRKMSRFTGIICTIFITCFIQAQAIRDTVMPAVAIKNNLLYDAAGTFNLGAELRLNRKLTLDLPFNYNPGTWSRGWQMKHLLFQP